MPDEAPVTEAPTIGTPPEPEAPPEGTPSEAPQTDTPETDWQKRYEDLRPEADRRESLLADLEGRNGPERQAQALDERAGILLEDEEGPPEDDEFDLPPDPSEEIAQIRQELAERDEEAEVEEFEEKEREFIETTIAELEQEHKVKLSDRQYQFIVNDALANRNPHDGEPDLTGAFEAWKEERSTAGIDYGRSKLDAAIPPVGTSGEPKIDDAVFRDKEKRQKLGTEIYEAAERASET